MYKRLATSKLYHTLVATYTNLGNDKGVSKTLTGWTVGQLGIIGHTSTASNVPEFCQVKITAGSLIGVANNMSYSLGAGSNTHFENTNAGRGMSYVFVATATSVTFDLYDVDSTEKVYIYR